MSPPYTVEEIAALLQIAPATVRNRLCRGEDLPPSLRIGRRRLFPRDQFEAWLDSHETSRGAAQTDFGPIGGPTLGRTRARWNP
jgi:excisionase family DNA binding protein